MTIDQSAIGAVTQAMRTEVSTCRSLDLEGLAVVAVATLQGLGWQGPHRERSSATSSPGRRSPAPGVHSR